MRTVSRVKSVQDWAKMVVTLSTKINLCIQMHLAEQGVEYVIDKKLCALYRCTYGGLCDPYLKDNWEKCPKCRRWWHKTFAALCGIYVKKIFTCDDCNKIWWPLENQLPLYSIYCWSIFELYVFEFYISVLQFWIF